MSQPTASHLFHLSNFSIDLTTIQQIQWDKGQEHLRQEHPRFSSLDLPRIHPPPKTYIYCKPPVPYNGLLWIFVLDGKSEFYRRDVEKLKLGVGFTEPQPEIFTPVELLRLLAQIPPTVERRPFDDDKPDGYMESDRDYIENNTEAAVWFLEHAATLREMGRQLLRLHPDRYQEPG